MRLEVGSADELGAWLRERAPARVRLQGRGTQWRPAGVQAGAHGEGGDVATVSFARMARILQFEPGDLTCSVEPGVTVDQLAAELHPHRLRLSCAGSGTIGGLCAADPFGPLAPAGHSPRSLLLGMSGVLADGTQWKSGARVVKSVAGFDLHKLFVGSRGRLFAATALHLKLLPAPRCERSFAAAHDTPAAALQQFERLRLLAVPPAALWLETASGATTVRGTFAGRDSFVREQFTAHALDETAAVAAPPPPAPGCMRSVRLLHPARVLDALRDLPAGGRAVYTAGGRLFVDAPRPAPGTAPARDAGALLLEGRLREQFDPRGVWQ